MDDTDLLPAFDPDAAWALAGGKPEIRDRVLAGTLAFLAADAGVAPLLDIGSYRLATAARGELAHRAIGLAIQAGMPRLARLFRDLTDALEAGRIAEAERLGGLLPEAIREAREAVATLARHRF